jgi:hypothetical protein
MEATFSSKLLAKTYHSFARNPNSTKFLLSHCEGTITETTLTIASWLHILKLLKLDTSDHDKPRVLLGTLEKYGEVVVKIGNTYDITNDIEKALFRLKGFVKYICYLECNDDFRTIPSSHRNTLCKGPGSSVKVLVMPYFPLGSLASFSWNKDKLPILHSCIKHTALSFITAFQNEKFIHNDLHAGNVLLKTTKQTSVSYEIKDVGIIADVPIYGIRPWIMDFEKSQFVEPNSLYDTILMFNNFYYDLTKLFMFLKETIPIDFRTIQPILMFLGQLNMKSVYMTLSDITTLLHLVDGIDLSSPLIYLISPFPTQQSE